MPAKTVAPYGSWKSPITSDLIVSTTTGIGRATQIVLDGEDIYWSEGRPEEGGRIVVVKRSPDGQTADLNPSPYNVRTTVHEYGGGSYAVSNGVLYFSHFYDQRLYRLEQGGDPEPLTPAVDLRYADGDIDAARNWMFCIREDHTTGSRWPVNTIVKLDLSGGDGGAVLASGNDFYASPRLSPDRRRLSWITWNHPNMLWDGSELWMAEVNDDGSLGGRQMVAGGGSLSVSSPEWTPNGDLIFVSEQTGWYNLYRWSGGQVEALTNEEAEFGGTSFGLGSSGFGVESANCVVCIYNAKGSKRLATLDLEGGSLEDIDTAYTEVGFVRASNGYAVISGGSPTEPASVVRIDLATGEADVLRRGTSQEIDSAYMSRPEPIEFPTEDGLTSHAFYYSPANKDFEAPTGERLPLIVISHGGPTGATSTVLNLSIQYWTSRGIGVVDVNYGGSTGYGREYRERLRGRWGIVDLDDCVNAAKYLIERGNADSDRVAIRGGSAGGYTTLASLTFRDFYKAGASHFGLSELEAMVRDTHKLESRYLDNLIGPYPERKDLYYERSPVHFADQITCPLIMFQGLEDKVVPPNQAEFMLEAMRERGMPVAYVAFEGEQHGFRKSENIKRALDGELYFYSRVFEFELAEPVDPVEIENLKSGS